MHIIFQISPPLFLLRAEMVPNEGTKVGYGHTRGQFPGPLRQFSQHRSSTYANLSVEGAAHKLSRPKPSFIYLSGRIWLLLKVLMSFFARPEV